MPPDLSIFPLADKLEAIPLLVRWFVEEWAPYYGPGGPGDAEQDLIACRNRDHIPLGLVAMDGDGQMVGTASLKPDSLASHRHLGPWLAAMLVPSEYRRRGIGSALLAAIEGEARRLGFDCLYTGTDRFTAQLRRRGWRAVEEDIPTLRAPTTIYRLNLKQT